ncbi:MAG: GlxA family transcriptional regulator [Vicinamibacteria bacterium]
MSRERAHRIAALCLHGLVAFDLSAAAEVFDLAWRSGRPAYEFSACAVEPGSVSTTTGFSIGELAGLEAIERAETVIVPGYIDIFAPPPEPALEALREAAARGTRMVSICTGAFALAFAGVLDGHRVTTHWFAAGELAELFPRLDVDPGALYVDDGQVLTSAGLSAGIDLCLHLVRSDHGERVGARVARAMVAAPHRAGGQAQFIERALPALNDNGSLQAVRAWALEHLTEPLDVATLADRASVSPRTFARKFVAETGTTPLKWLHTQRVLEARRLLEHTDLPVEQVAARAGFGSAPSLREHFRRATATTPTAYRRTFAGVRAS